MNSGRKSQDKGYDRRTEAENQDGSGSGSGTTEGSQEKCEKKLHGAEAGGQGNGAGKQEGGTHGSKNERYRKRKTVCKHTGDQIEQALHENREEEQDRKQFFIVQDISGFFLKQGDLFLEL